MSESREIANMPSQQPGEGSDSGEVKITYGAGLLAGRSHAQIVAFDMESYIRKSLWFIVGYLVFIPVVTLTPLPLYLLVGLGACFVTNLFFSSLFMTHNQIRLTKDGIRFPWYFYLPLGRRLSCSWSELAEISLVDNNPKFRLGHRVEFRLSSGHKASVQLCRIDDEEIGSFCDEVERKAPHAVSINTMDRIRNWHSSEHTNSKALTFFEQLPNYLSDRYSLVSFVPTPPNSTIGDRYLVSNKPFACGGISALHLGHSTDGSPSSSVLLREYWLGWLPESERQVLVDEVSDRVRYVTEALSEPLWIRLKTSTPTPIQIILRPVEVIPQFDRFFITNEDLSTDTVTMLLNKELKSRGKSATIIERLEYLAYVIEELHKLEQPVIFGILDPSTIRFARSRREPLILTPPGVVALLTHRTGYLLGNPSYIAPEVLQAEVGAAADVYSFGKIAYYLLARRHPEHFEQPSFHRCANISQPLREMILASTEPQPDKRISITEARKILTSMCRNSFLQGLSDKDE